MSAAPKDAEAAPAPAKGGKKKLLFILLGVLLVLGLVGGGAAFYVIKKNAAAAAAAEEDGGEPAPVEHAAKSHEPPTFVKLDPFVVNLADKDVDRYAQIEVQLQVRDAATAEEFKNYMPAVRNAILMILAHKTSEELLSREGKKQLAQDILRESVRPLGIDIPETPGQKGPKNPVQDVLFVSFIIQ